MISGRAFGATIVILLVLVFGGSWLADYDHSRDVHLSAYISPAILPADGAATGNFVVRVTGGNGGPRVGDTIEILNLTSRGTFDRTRALTDGSGKAAFTYTASLANVYQPAGPVGVSITDTSLGHLLELDKTMTATIRTVDPSKFKKGS